jgi:hypothetical protein
MTRALILVAVGLCALVGLAFAARLSWDAAVAVYLVGWLFWTGISAGSFALLLVAQVTGGRWEATARPVLTPFALAMPLLALAMLPILLALPTIYPWAGDAGAAKHAAVASLYLNVPGFVLRAVLILALWSALAWFAVMTRLTPLTAGLGLIVYVVTLFFASVDWVMSVDAKWASTAFPAMLAVSQIGGALAVVGVAQGLHEGDAETDIAGLLLAATLGLTYLAFVAGLVMWSGNLPDKLGWFVTRFRDGWTPVVWAMFLVGAVVPFAMLVVERVRRSRRLSGLAALCVLVGLALHEAWLLAPAVGGPSLLPAALAVVAVGALLLAANAMLMRWRGSRLEAACG